MYEPAGDDDDDDTTGGALEHGYVPEDACGEGDAACEFALLFDGEDDFVQILDTGALAAIHDGPFTLELWFRGPPGDEDPQLLTNLDPERGTGLELGFLGDTLGGPGLTVELGQTKLSLHTTAPLRDDAWHHLGLRRDGGQLDLFVDGVPVSTVHDLDQALTPLGGAQPLWIGRGRDRRSESAFAGLIAELRLWSAARSDDAIAATAGHRVTGSEAALVGYWPLWIGGGQTVLDQVGEADGVLGGDTRAGELDPRWIRVPAPFASAE